MLGALTPARFNFTGLSPWTETSRIQLFGSNSAVGTNDMQTTLMTGAPTVGSTSLSNFTVDLFSTGFSGTLSLELFNPNYWKEDALTVARTGLEKMNAAVAKAVA